MYEMDDAIASHIVAITKKVFALTEQDTFYQLGQMSKFIKELDKEFDIKYKEEGEVDYLRRVNEILWSYIPESDYELNEKINNEINEVEAK